MTLRFIDATLCLALALAFPVPGALGAEDAPARDDSRQAAVAEGEPAGRPSGKASDGLLSDLSLTSSNEPIVVRSDQLEFDYQQNRVVYRGDVNVQQGELAIDCKELIVNLERVENKESLQLREVVAIGDVVITQGDRRATGGRAIFSQPTRQITLLENPVLHDGPNEVTGERLIVYLDEGRSVVESSAKKRVSAILYPGDSGEGLDLGAGGKAGEDDAPDKSGAAEDATAVGVSAGDTAAGSKP